MQIDLFAKTRPYLYHLTHRVNLDHISKANGISPASLLMERAGRVDLIRTRRPQHEKINIEDTLVLVRDQAPLRGGNLELAAGFSYEDLVELINRRVFFWPGTESGPIKYGTSHFRRYRAEHPVILRLQFRSLLQANPMAEPKFCRYNSGSPRCSSGNKSPRGPEIFLRAEEFEGTPSSVVEVTFESPITLPANTTIAECPIGPWRPISP